MANFLISPKDIYSAIDDNGNPLTGGQLYTYIAGSSTPADTFTDASGNTKNDNPIILDSRGEAPVWLDDTMVYKFVLRYPASEGGGIIRTTDSISANNGGGSVGISFVTHSDSDTITLDGLGTAGSPLTANALISSISSNALGITTSGISGGMFVNDLTPRVVSLEDAVAVIDTELDNKLDKVQAGAQSVASEVTFNEGLILGDSTWIKPTTPQAPIFLTNGVNPSGLNTTVAMHNDSLILTAGDGSAQSGQLNMGSSGMDFIDPNGKYIFYNLKDETPIKALGRNASNEVVEFDTGSSSQYVESTGMITDGEGILSIGTPNTTFSITDGTAQIEDLGVITPISWSGKTNISVTNIATQNITFISIDMNGNVIQRGTRWTPEQFSSEIVLGVVVHVNRTFVDAVNNEQAVATNATQQVGDVLEGIGFLNLYGNKFSPFSTNLQLSKTDGTVMNRGINFVNGGHENPHKLNLPVLNPITALQYRMKDGSSGSPTATDVNPNIWDDGSPFGSAPSVPTNKYTVQRIFSFTSNNVKIQAGQAVYNSLAEAKGSIQTEAFITEPSIVANGILRGYLCIKQGTTNLSDVNKVFFLDPGKYGGGFGTGGLSVSTMQNTYDNSTNPEIITDTTRGALTVRRGSALDSDDVIEVQNGAGTKTAGISGSGIGLLDGLILSNWQTDPNRNIVGVGALNELIDTGVNVSDISNKLDKVQAGAQSVASEVTFQDDVGIIKSVPYSTSADLSFNMGNSLSTSVNTGAVFRWRNYISGNQFGQFQSIQSITRDGTWSTNTQYTGIGAIFHKNVTLPNLPTGTQTGIVGYDATGKLMQGSFDYINSVASLDSDTINFAGIGTSGAPLTADIILNANPSNLLSSSASGLLAQANWGDIGGSLSNQTDLNTALDNKLDKIDATAQSVASEVTFNSGIDTDKLLNVPTGVPEFSLGQEAVTGNLIKYVDGAVTTPSLQQVTDVGSVTTNGATFGGLLKSNLGHENRGANYTNYRQMVGGLIAFDAETVDADNVNQTRTGMGRKLVSSSALNAPVLNGSSYSYALNFCWNHTESDINPTSNLSKTQLVIPYSTNVDGSLGDMAYRAKYSNNGFGGYRYLLATDSIGNYVMNRGRVLQGGVTDDGTTGVQGDNARFIGGLVVGGTVLASASTELIRTSRNSVNSALYTYQYGAGNIHEWRNGDGLPSATAQIANDGSFTTKGNITAVIPTGTQNGLVGYDATGKLIQGSTSDLLNKVDATAQSVVSEVTFQSGVSVTGNLADGSAINMPNGGWIRPNTVGQSLYLTNDANPGQGSRLHLNSANILLQSAPTGVATPASELELGADGVSYLRGNTSLSLVGDNGGLDPSLLSLLSGVISLGNSFGSYVINGGGHAFTSVPTDTPSFTYGQNASGKLCKFVGGGGGSGISAWSTFNLGNIEGNSALSGVYQATLIETPADIAMTTMEVSVDNYVSASTVTVAVYDEAGTTKLKEATASVSATGFLNMTAFASYTLTGGTKYWIAMTDSHGSNSFGSKTGGASFPTSVQKSGTATGSFGTWGLPTSIAGGTATTTAMYIGVKA